MPPSNEYLSAAISALYVHLKGPEYRQFEAERGFILWYAKARYGKDAPVVVTDGSGDGGIDAVVKEHSARVVIQAKYEPSKQLRTVRANDIRDFENLARRIRDEDAVDEFNKWIGTVRSDLRTMYRDLRRSALQDPNSVRFDFVTSKRITDRLHQGLDAVDAERIAPLWHLYEEGFTPPTEKIELEFEDLWFKEGSSQAVRNYVGIADVLAFRSLMKHDIHERLFAQNVRTDLKSGLNKHIRLTYETAPDEFWMGNNGIYVVCSKATRSGNTLQLLYPSIINGSQTLHSINRSESWHKCRILVRVLEMDLTSNQGMLSAIIKRTNSQNPMKPMNLAAHDREQLNVARYLDSAQVFYERRENEWKNEKKMLLAGYMQVGMKDVAQWVAVTEGEIGIGSARAKVKELFQGDQYKNVFGRFGDDLHSQVYRKLSMAVLSALIVRQWIQRLAATPKGDARILQLLLVKAVYRAIELSEALTKDSKRLLQDRVYRDAVTTGIARELAAMARTAVLEQKRYSKVTEEIDLSNYFKRDKLTAVAFTKAASSAAVRRLSTVLEQALLAT